MKAHLLILLIAANALLACNNKPKAADGDSVIATAAADTPMLAEAAAEPVTDSLQIPIYEDPTLPLKLISQSAYHGDEVPANTTSLQWIGLFIGETGYYTAPAHLKTTRVEDVVLDENGEKTGIQISSDNPDSAFLFITKNEFISGGPVSAVHVGKAEDYGVAPGTSRKFELKGNTYTIYATADSSGEGATLSYLNYKLYLNATINGNTTTQLLAASMHMDDQLMNVLFAGDIDGDGLMDFILETSYHYNVMAPTLYLSKPAEAGKLLKLMGVNYSVGC
ncbi:hypothetical protein [uncultured Chitinophaga sp.]|uniref:hypothetical protein n=1 Tax=uncultured Chitinophaga sp. TaxID=339340 RepID=UPI0025EF874A|nr:hypothetical protein [uncultured Chitinophaga sp.]